MKPKLLVPFDFGATAVQALQWAADLHRTAGGEPIVMVHAINSLPVAALEVAVNPMLPDAAELAELERSMREAARKLNVPADARVLIEPKIPGETIIAAARDVHADLIVMGAHGRTGIKRMLLGSVAEHVLRHAPCPVVTLRGPQGG